MIQSSPIIIKVNPSSTSDINDFYKKVKLSCVDYESLSYEEFLDCRNSIYQVYQQNSYSPYGFIGCRKAFINKDLGIDDLPYHCQKNDMVYEIKFIHYEDFYNKDTENRNSTKRDIMNKLIYECLADKNDSFCIVKDCLCRSIYTDNYNCLIDNDFKKIDDSKNPYWIRFPRTQ